jgi:hypothetical protein
MAFLLNKVTIRSTHLFEDEPSGISMDQRNEDNPRDAWRSIDGKTMYRSFSWGY